VDYLGSGPTGYLDCPSPRAGAGARIEHLDIRFPQVFSIVPTNGWSLLLEGLDIAVTHSSWVYDNVEETTEEKGN